MIDSYKQLKLYIQADRIINGYSEKKNLPEVLRNVINGGGIISYLYHMRCSSYYRKRNSILFYYHNWKYKRLGIRLGFSIGEDCFGYGLMLPHYGTIVVGGNNRFGNCCVIFTDTTVTASGSKFGDGLYLGTGAKIVKKVSLGNYVSISANTVVNKSFEEDNILLGGCPAYKIKYTEKWFERGDDYNRYRHRVDRIETLKVQYGL